MRHFLFSAVSCRAMPSSLSVRRAFARCSRGTCVALPNCRLYERQVARRSYGIVVALEASEADATSRGPAGHWPAQHGQPMTELGPARLHHESGQGGTPDVTFPDAAREEGARLGQLVLPLLDAQTFVHALLPGESASSL